MEDTFKINAVYSINGDCYHHFGIHPSIANMYGDKPEDIKELTMKISADQTSPDLSLTKADYWGWFDIERQEFTIIYPKRFLLEMCFPYGSKVCEERNQGKSYRLEIIK